MSLLSADVLDRVVKNTVEWYLNNRNALIGAMEESGRPYGQTALSGREQLARFLNMTPEDWSILIENRMQRYRGQPNALALTGQDIGRFRKRMQTLAAQYGIEGVGEV